MNEKKFITIAINEDGKWDWESQNLNLVEIAGLLKIATKLIDYQILKEFEKN